MDAFLKTTHEVLGPLNLATVHDRLTQFDFVDKERRLCRATYGEGAAATVVVVNDSFSPLLVASRLGGQVLLPPGDSSSMGLGSRRSWPCAGTAAITPTVPCSRSARRTGETCRRPAGSGSSTALATHGSTGEGRPTRSAARRSSGSPDDAGAGRWQEQARSVVLETLQLPFVNARRPALLELHGEPDGGRLHGGEFDLAPAVLRDGIAPVAATGFQASPSRYSIRHDAGNRHVPRPVSSNQ